jgi:organic hydroperoxide reductase OsmC/OhrA
MKITAHVQNSYNHHHVTLATNDNAHSITIPPKASGYGSSANGGELLFLALATCYCNDIYREAAARGIEVTAVEVTVEGEFGAAGEPARNVTYRAKITGKGSAAELEALVRHTDTMAEIQNTLRGGASVILGEVEVIPSF